MVINIEKQKEDIETLKYRDRDKEEKIKELERLVLETNETHRKKIIELKTEIQELFEKFENQNSGQTMHDMNQGSVLFSGNSQAASINMLRGVFNFFVGN